MLRQFYARLTTNVGWVVIVAIAVFGMGCILIDLAYGDATGSATWFNKLASFLGSVGKAALGGGVSGAVIKILATEGFFLDAVAAITFGDEGLKRRSPEERVELWRTLTRMIYLPFLASSNAQTAGDAARRDLASALEQAIAKSFTYSSTFYIDNISRNIELRWADAATREFIEIHDWQDFVIIPFDASAPVEWVTQSSPDSGRQMSDYTIEEKASQIVPPPRLPGREQSSADSRRVTYLLEGSDRYEVHRHRIWRWRLENDPIFSMVSPYVVRGMSLQIRNRAEGLHVAFKVIGGKVFDVAGGARSRIDFNDYSTLRASSLLLPDQGLTLVLVSDRAGLERD